MMQNANKDQNANKTGFIDEMYSTNLRFPCSTSNN